MSGGERHRRAAAATSRRAVSGAELLGTTLARLGVDCVFGLPGMQNLGLYEALRRGAIRTVLASQELAAAFMANGYARTSGGVGVLATVPGPGFACALTGLAEARHDSAAVLHITTPPPRASGRRHPLQALDQAAIAAPIVKGVFDIERAQEIPGVLGEAHALAVGGEPGPVLVQIAEEAVADGAPVAHEAPEPTDDREPPLDAAALRQAVALVGAARRPLLFAGQGAADAAAELRRLAELLGAPVLTTLSGRGILPEDHPLALGFDPARGGVDALNRLIASADLVIALGCKLGHTGSAGFRLRLPAERLIRVDAERANLDANYSARLAVHGRVEAFLADVLRSLDASARGPSDHWGADAVAAWRARPAGTGGLPEPAIRGIESDTPAGLFAALRRALPRDAILVTDSGLHQMLARRHFPVLAPRGLLCPSDFQSMGFGLPAAIGAALAAPERTVVAVVGDGGFTMSGLELLTAIRERLRLTVLVFNDGWLNLIRLQQYAAHGHAHATRLRNPDFETFASAVGARYIRLEGDAEPRLYAAIRGRGVTLVDVTVADSPVVRTLHAKAAARETIRGWLGGRLSARLKQWFGHPAGHEPAASR
ncbi:MAG TPA: thiamine pyrophosphate-binding protein [Longimicrobiales bacterium]